MVGMRACAVLFLTQGNVWREIFKFRLASARRRLVVHLAFANFALDIFVARPHAHGLIPRRSSPDGKPLGIGAGLGFRPDPSYIVGMKRRVLG